MPRLTRIYRVVAIVAGFGGGFGARGWWWGGGRISSKFDGG
jgi:hypothetical protein